MIVTIADLRRLRACSEQVEKFLELFPDGLMEITEAVCLEHAQAFDWDWAAKNLLTPMQHAEYQRVQAQAYAEYERQKARAFWLATQQKAEA